MSSGVYDFKHVSDELVKTAFGLSYFGNALRSAKDLPCVGPEGRSLLDKFATRLDLCDHCDREALKDLAAKIRLSHNGHFNDCDAWVDAGVKQPNVLEAVIALCVEPEFVCGAVFDGTDWLRADYGYGYVPTKKVR